MLIYRNAEGVHGLRKFENTCLKPKPSHHGGALVGLVPKQSSKPLKLKHEAL